jgi:type IV pilus assembly protein PilM
MLGIMQNFLSPRPNPIGVDFGSDCLRLAQLQSADGDFRLTAAASEDVPAHVRRDPQSRLEFFADHVRQLLSQSHFRGRHAILALPASLTNILHLRLPRMDEAQLKEAILAECRGRLPIDPSDALIRHIIAGESVSHRDSKMDVLVVAAARDWINQFLATAAKAKLDVIGMNVESMALIDCFSHVYRRKSDQQATTCFLDIGGSGSRATISRDGKILFARSLGVGGEHFTRQVADDLQISFEEAKTLRLKLAALTPADNAIAERHAGGGERRAGGESAGDAFSLLRTKQTAESRASRKTSARAVGLVDHFEIESPDANSPDRMDQVENACRPIVSELVQELLECRTACQLAFPTVPVSRLIFVGGEARQLGICRQIAKEMALPAAVGDPMCRLNRDSAVGIESGIDRRMPQPAWAIAMGLSMGPQMAESQ